MPESATRRTFQIPVWMFCCLLCVAGEEVIGLLELEGNTVTIHTGGTGVPSDAQILWFYRPEDVDIRIVNSQIIGGEIITDYYIDRFRDRLQLNRTSGSLTIRHISREDSGVYKLLINTKHPSIQRYRIDVYAPVSAPIICRNERHTSEPCSPLCSVENGKDVNLSWYEGEEIISTITSPNSSEPLYLPLNETHPNSTYICVAANPVSSQTTQLNFTELCYKAGATFTLLTGILIPVVVIAATVVLAVFVWYCIKRTRQQGMSAGLGLPGLLCVAGEEVIRLQELEGNTVTIHTGRTGVQSDAQILWFYGPESADIKIVDSLVFEGEIITDYNRDRLQLNRTSGSLTIRNISREDSGVYRLLINTKHPSVQRYRIDVYGPESNWMTVILISVGVIVAAAIPTTVWCLKKKTRQQGKEKVY
ncbi:hypothetical protein NFI96_004401 [Prochilodus magdalenae]|nr:hypothetical protein NFI96_004401 [Prochilodus magdalenae]